MPGRQGRDNYLRLVDVGDVPLLQKDSGRIPPQGGISDEG